MQSPKHSFPWSALAILPIIAALIVILLLSLSSTRSLTRLTHNIHAHPMQVQASVVSAKYRLVSVQNGLTKLLLYVDAEHRDQLAQHLRLDSEMALSHVKNAHSLFLGDKSMTAELISSIESWRLEQQAIGDLVSQGQQEKIVESLASSQRQLEHIFEQIHDVEVFAQNKADEVLETSEAKEAAFSRLLSALILGTIAAGVAVMLLIVSLVHRTKELGLQVEERLRNVIDASPIPTIVHAKDGQILMINRQWSELTGYQYLEIPTIQAWADKAGHVPAPFASSLQSEADDFSDGECLLTTASGCEARSRQSSPLQSINPIEESSRPAFWQARHSFCSRRRWKRWAHSQEEWRTTSTTFLPSFSRS